jgi:hypothetical protein
MPWICRLPYCLVVTVCVCAHGAAAQDIGAWGIGLGSSGLAVAQWETVMQGAAAAVQEADRGPQDTPRRGTTRYRADRTISARLREEFASHVAQSLGPGAGEQVRAELRRRDPIESWSAIVAGRGLAPGDAADAVTGYWILNWEIATRGTGTSRQAQAVRRQVLPLMTSHPAYTALGDAQRQEFAEVLMLNFLVEHTAYVEAVQRQDEPQLQRLAEAAVERFRTTTGVDLRILDLTDQGFVPKS